MAPKARRNSPQAWRHPVELGLLPRKPRHPALVQHQQRTGPLLERRDDGLHRPFAAAGLAVDVAVEAAVPRWPGVDVGEVDAMPGELAEHRLQRAGPVVQLDQERHPPVAARL
jgi:hypothetical protein